MDHKVIMLHNDLKTMNLFSLNNGSSVFAINMTSFSMLGIVGRKYTDIE